MAKAHPIRRGLFPQDLTGLTFGRWTVLAYQGKLKGPPCVTLWLCCCDCGTRRIVHRTNLTLNRSKSCGCYRRDFTKQKNFTHGKSKTAEYGVWAHMIRRCQNRNCQDFPNYGGRGIVVCDRWLGTAGFVNFLSDLGERPSPKHSIDRIDPNGNYCPENCRWLPLNEQVNTRRCTVWLTFKGETKTITQWSRQIGLTIRALRYRIAAGWTVDRILKVHRPVRQKRV